MSSAFDCHESLVSRLTAQFGEAGHGLVRPPS
jgi:hypothetical protein